MQSDQKEPKNLQIVRTRHPPFVYLEQVALLHTEAGFPITTTDIKLRLDELPREDRLLLAVEGETLLGYAHLRIMRNLTYEKTSEIVTIVVRQSYRRRSIGRRLVNAAETWSRESGYKRLLMRINADNKDAHGFLKALGYEQSLTNDEFVSDLY
jgi:GNAT superfamily N-acetyltransferase